MQEKIFLFHPEHNSVVILDPPSPPGKVWQGRHDQEFRKVELPLGIGCELIN